MMQNGANPRVFAFGWMGMRGDAVYPKLPGPQWMRVIDPLGLPLGTGPHPMDAVTNSGSQTKPREPPARSAPSRRPSPHQRTGETRVSE